MTAALVALVKLSAVVVSAAALSAMVDATPSRADPRPCHISADNAAGAKPVELQPVRDCVAPGAAAAMAVPSELNPYLGKLRLRIAGVSHYCSGIFVGPKVVMTAAHCIRPNGIGPGANYDLQVFVTPQVAPYNVKFDSDGNPCVAVPPGWDGTTQPYLRIEYDFAFVGVVQQQAGGTLTVTLETKKLTGADVILFGYPYSLDTGNTLTGVAGTVQQDILHPNQASLTTNVTGFTEGTSGGPWLTKISGNKVSIVTVSSSYATPLYGSDYIRIYGPNLDQDLLQTALAVATSCAAN